MAKVKYREGDWFAVPLRDGGYGVGLIARANPAGVLVGYFFGPRRERIPSLDELRDMKAADADLVGRFGHLGITQGKWSMVGRHLNWNRSDWPMPVFVRVEELSGRAFNVFYADEDPNRILREEPIQVGSGGEPKDGLMGAGFVEKVLNTALGGNSGSSPADHVAGGAMRVWHHLYFPNRRAAEGIAARLRNKGYLADVREAAPKWLLVAEHEVRDDDAALESAARELERQAATASGEYDGWERAPQPKRPRLRLN